MASKVKSTARRSTKANSNKEKTRKPLHLKIESLMLRPNGATLHDTWNAGWHFPVMQAVKMVQRHGLKVKVIKKKGELTHYVAKRG